MVGVLNLEASRLKAALLCRRVASMVPVPA